MAATVARLEAILSADTRNYDQALDRTERKTHRFGGVASKAFALMGKAAIAGGVAAGGGLVYSIKAASDLGEQINKSNVVFGKNAKTVNLWSRNLTRSFGLSQRAALEAAGTYGNMLKPMGLAPPLVAKMSTKMTELAGDLASFNNASPEQTLEALRSGLAGETEPLRKFGIFLSDARLREEAMRLGLTTTTKEVLPAAIKAQATYSLIMKDSSDAQGDFARTGNSMPNLLRTFRGELENAAASLGQIFLPFATRLLGWAVDMIPNLQNLISWLIDKLAPAFEHVRNWIRRVIDITPQIIDAFRNQAGSMDGARAAARNLGQRLADLVQTNFAAIRASSPALVQTIDNIRQSLSNLGTVAKLVLLPILGGMAIFFKFTLPIAIRVTASVLEVLSGWLVTITKGIRWLSENGAKAIVGFKDASLSALNKVADAAGKFAAALGKVKDALNWIVSNAKKISGVFSGIGGAVSGAAGKISPFGDAFDPKFIPRGSRDLHGALPIMQPFANLGAAYGLHISAGRTDHAKFTRSGRISDHWYGKALDLADGPAQMAGFFRALIGNPRVKQAFYDPLGSIFAGHLSSYREGGHSGHVHVATYDKGGWLNPGLTLAMNMSGKRERVLTAEQGAVHESHAKVLKLMSEIWSHTASFFRFLPQPPTRLLPDNSLFVGVDPSERPPKVYWPRWMSDALFGHGAGITRSDAFMTLIHEWAHAFQKKRVADIEWQAEGGATAFARRVAPIVAGAMHFPYRSPSTAGDPYTPYMVRVLRQLGLDWVMRGQFKFGVFDRGGFLPRGLSLAYNGTGRPEPVGAGTVNFYLPNYVGSKPELMSWMENVVREFRRRNGRSPF